MVWHDNGMDFEIVINFDFTTGDELSYFEGINSDRAFETNCLDFFTTENLQAKVVKKDGSFIAVKTLMFGGFEHSTKEIRYADNIRKMLIAGAFKWQPKTT